MRTGLFPLAAAISAIVSTSAHAVVPNPGTVDFAPFVLLPVQTHLAHSVAVGDVTGDGRDDIVLTTNDRIPTSTTDANSVLVYRQTKDGTLLAPLRIAHGDATPSQHHGVALGHLNEDKALDIVVTLGDGVLALLSTPEGGFARAKITTGREMQTVAFVDADRDGHLDVFAQTARDGATVLFGDGRGTLSRPTDIRTNGQGRNALGVGDLDGDGTRDVLISSADGSNDIGYSPVAPDGSGFLPTITLPFPNEWKRPYANAIGDFDGDGVNDIVTTGANALLEPQLNLFRGNGAGVFAAPAAFRTHGFTYRLAAGDLDGNGLTDLVAVHGGASVAVGYYLQGPKGLTAERVVSAPFSTLTPSPQGIAIGDIDGNGCADVVLAESPGVLVFKARNCKYRTTHDYDGDGRSDILWRNATTGANALWKAGSHLQQQAIAGVTHLPWKIVGQGDFDADGKDDIVWRNATSGENAIWRSGNNTTQIAMAPVATLAWEVVGVGDFDADGKSDIAWRNGQTGANVIWRSGDMASPIPVTGVGNLQWKIAGVGDFDGDGKSDLLWRNPVSGGNTIWRSGNNALQTGMQALPASWKLRAVGDFDADGRDDLVWRNSDGAHVIWNGADARKSRPLVTVAAAQWQIVATGDYNGDGKDDLLWRDSVGGRGLIWHSADPATQRSLANMGAGWSILPSETRP